MNHALVHAKKGNGSVSPNPLVGAVITKNGEKIGEGFHEYYGGPHAEVNAIQNAEKNGHPVSDATLFVTLEPCSHSGKTPPCTNLIREKKIARVVFAASDPNPLARGGAGILQKAGIEVVSGVLEEKAREQNQFFFHFWENHRPFFLGKIAISHNGLIANPLGEKTIISEEKALKYGHTLRARCDAILVGINTALSDDPKLTVRHSILGKNPLRILLDTSGKCAENAQILHDSHFLIFSSEYGKEKLLKKNISPENIIVFPTKIIPPKDIAQSLFQRGISSVLVEGGAATLRTFFEAKLLDEFHLMKSKKVLSANGVSFAISLQQYGFSMTQKTPLGNSDVLEIWKPKTERHSS